LREILDSGRPQPGQKGMLLAFGAGFSAFAALVEFASAWMQATAGKMHRWWHLCVT